MSEPDLRHGRILQRSGRKLVVWLLVVAVLGAGTGCDDMGLVPPLAV